VRDVSFGADAGVPLQQTCRAYVSAVSQCAALGKAAGYVGYKGGADLSTGFCYTKDTKPGGF
jgi:hypothetical protein